MNEAVTRVATPTDLRAMRELLGLTREEVGHLMGVGPGEIRDSERARTHYVFARHVNLLEHLLARVNGELDGVLETTRATTGAPDILIVFPNDGVFKDYEPELASWMPFNSVHQHFVWRQLDAWMADGARPVTVELVPTQYQEFLGGLKMTGGAKAVDCESTRRMWAREHVKVIKMHQG